MSEVAVEVSAARAEEHAELGRIVVAAYRSVNAAVGPEYEAVLADVAARAAEAGTSVLAARVDGAVVGCATLALFGSTFSHAGDGGTATLRMVGVDPAAQGLGAGRALVLQAIDEARAAGCTRMFLSTQPVMERAQRLYESLGFRRVPGGDQVVRDGLCLLAYELDLAPERTPDVTAAG